MRNWLTTKKLSRFDTLALMVYAALLAQYRSWTACGVACHRAACFRRA